MQSEPGSARDEAPSEVVGQMTATGPNFTLLDLTLPDVARLIAAIVRARDAVDRRSWAHPQEPTGEEW